MKKKKQFMKNNKLLTSPQKKNLLEFRFSDLFIRFVRNSRKNKNRNKKNFVALKLIRNAFSWILKDEQQNENISRITK